MGFNNNSLNIFNINIYNNYSNNVFLSSEDCYYGREEDLFNEEDPLSIPGRGDNFEGMLEDFAIAENLMSGRDRVYGDLPEYQDPSYYFRNPSWDLPYNSFSRRRRMDPISQLLPLINLLIDLLTSMPGRARQFCHSCCRKRYLPDILGRSNRVGRRSYPAYEPYPSSTKTKIGKGKYEQIIRETARKYGVPEDLALAVASKESGFNQKALSPKGAIGIFQLMPDTARGLGVNPNDPLQNIKGGILYLRQLLDQFKNTELAVAAYNAGPTAVKKHGGIPPYKETQKYVQRVMTSRTGFA